MSFITKFIGSIFKSAPKVSNQATQTLDKAQATANTGRAALYETAGGQSGQELDPTQVQKRDTLLGN